MPGYRGRIGEPPAFCNVHVDVQLDDDYQELGGEEVIIYRLAADPAAQIAALEAQLAPLTEALAAAQKHIASLVEQRTRQARLLGNYEEKVAEARVAGREMGLYSAAEWLRENCPGIAADEMVAALSLPNPPAPEAPAAEEECPTVDARTALETFAIEFSLRNCPEDAVEWTPLHCPKRTGRKCEWETAPDGSVPCWLLWSLKRRGGIEVEDPEWQAAEGDSNAGADLEAIRREADAALQATEGAE